jgi:hypothetical protein
MEFTILKPCDLQKKAEEEEDAKIQAVRQAIIDFTNEILTKAEFNVFLEENKTTFLTEGEKVLKTISFDLKESKIRGIGITDVCQQIKNLLNENEYCTEINSTESIIRLEVWIDPQYFRDLENVEDK